MGAYLYKVNPSQVRNVRVEFKDGSIRTVPVGRFYYAYKPYWSDDELNEKLYRRYVQPTEMAWAKSGRDKPEFGVLEDSQSVFTTGGLISVMDDYIGFGDYGPQYVGKIVS